jgi:hypothetical protein
VTRRLILRVDDETRDRLNLEPLFPSVAKQKFGPSYGYTGVTVESDENVPDPPRVQEFHVRVVTEATENPWSSEYIKRRLGVDNALWKKSITVTEVEPKEEP